MKPQPRTVLVIEGDPVTNRSLDLMLAAEAFLVETASCGADGVRHVGDRAFDLVVVGADLPDMSGLEAACQIRRASPRSVIVFASVSPATLASNATLHLSDCT